MSPFHEYALCFCKLFSLGSGLLRKEAESRCEQRPGPLSGTQCSWTFHGLRTSESRGLLRVPRSTGTMWALEAGRSGAPSWLGSLGQVFKPSSAKLDSKACLSHAD